MAFWADRGFVVRAGVGRGGRKVVLSGGGVVLWFMGTKP